VYLYKFKYEESPECPTCSGVEEDAEHVFFVCPRFDGRRRVLVAAVGKEIMLETLIVLMLSSGAVWEAVSPFVAEVLKDLRREEQERRKEERKKDRADQNSQISPLSSR